MKIKFRIPIAWMLPLLLWLSSCQDIIDKNIAGRQLNIEAPADNYISDNYSTLFWWDTLNGTANYHLQIVSTSFSNIQNLVVDTLVTGNKFTYSLFPGKYQWRIRAENNTSTTTYITRNITIDSNSNFNGQTFSVQLPADNYNTNNTVVNFTWLSFPAATSYQYVLLDANQNMIETKSVIQTSIYDTLPEGQYYWEVKAVNALNNTATSYSPLRLLTIDLTAPGAPTLIGPANNSIDSNAIVLSWSNPSGTYADSVAIATDSSFTSLSYGYYLINNTSYQLQPLPLNINYYWRIKGRDQAGNWSQYSATYHFVVQQ